MLQHARTPTRKIVTTLEARLEARFTEAALDEFAGKRLRFHRRRQGLSQADLGALCGVTFQQIQKYECAFNRMTASRLAVFARVLAVPISDFFPADLTQASRCSNCIESELATRTLENQP
jgi:transcriptional regulator with XRE-family HTH domain